ncbi:hypothetical protein QFZ43_000096 [Streptomyces afghaniensis]|nr:hypothetical protein [Streptomyces afghaniensis]
MSNIFKTVNSDTPDQLAARSLFFELHDWDRSRTKEHFLYIYNRFYFATLPNDVTVHRAKSRAMALDYIDKRIFRLGSGRCLRCPRT